jgi:hypothetical protein
MEKVVMLCDDLIEVRIFYRCCFLETEAVRSALQFFSHAF